MKRAFLLLPFAFALNCAAQGPPVAGSQIIAGISEDTGKPVAILVDSDGSLKTSATLTGGGDASAANQTTIIGHVDGIETVLGTMDANTGSIKTAVELIGDTVKAEDAAHSSADKGIMALSVRKDTAAALAGADGDYQPLISNDSGALHVSVTDGVVAGTAGTPAADVVSVQGITSMTPVLVQPQAATTGGASIHGYVSTASINAITAKASAGTLYSLTAINPTAAKQYLRLYNKASAPDPSACNTNSDCPIAELIVPTSGDTNGAGFTIPLPSMGLAFSTGISYTLTAAGCTVLATCTDETNGGAGVSILAGFK